MTSKHVDFNNDTKSSGPIITNETTHQQSQAFLDDSKFSSDTISLESGHSTLSHEGTKDSPSKDIQQSDKIHIEYVARGRRRQSMEKDLKFAVSCKHTMAEDAYRAIGFKLLNQKRRPSVISFERVQDSSEEEGREEERPLKKLRRMEEISKANEDLNKGQTKEASIVKSNYAFFGVYDGHGGSEAAEYLRQNLHTKIVEHPNFEEDPVTAIREGFRKAEIGFNSLCANQHKLHGVGTTAVIALIATNNSTTTLYVAHVGHSEAMVCRKGAPLILTEPHTLMNQKEKDRIASAGGIIYEDRIAHPKFNPHYVNISVSRAIGDLYFKSEEYTEGKESGLIAEPQIAELELTTEDEFVILASDGFWNCVSKERAIEFVKKHKSDCDTNLICRGLTDLASSVGDRMVDDTTVLLIKLRNM